MKKKFITSGPGLSAIKYLFLVCYLDELPEMSLPLGSLDNMLKFEPRRIKPVFGISDQV